MEQAETFCDHIFILHRGKKIIDESIQSIKNKMNAYEIHLTDKLSKEFLLRTSFDIEEYAEYMYRIKMNENLNINDFLLELLEDKYTITYLEKNRLKLKQFFLELTSK